MKKVSLALLLLFSAMVMSVLFNFGEAPVFFKINRKLPIYCVDKKEKVAALTFDENWGNDNTKKILDILNKYKIKGTFFVLGKWADEFPDVVKEIHNSGNEIGNHSNMHPDMTRASQERIKNEIAETDAKIMKLTGNTTNLFRCPSGEYNDLVVQTVENTGHFCIQWDVDSIDWREDGAQVEYNRVINKTKPGSIILFHNNAKYTPDNLPKIIEKLQGEGYKFVKISDLIYKHDYHIEDDGRQIPN